MPSWRVKAPGIAQGVRRVRARAREKEEGGQGPSRWGPHPLGESPAVYLDIPAAPENQGCFQDSAAKVS